MPDPDIKMEKNHRFGGNIAAGRRRKDSATDRTRKNTDEIQPGLPPKANTGGATNEPNYSNTAQDVSSSSAYFSVPYLSVHFFVAGAIALRRKDGGQKNNMDRKMTTGQATHSIDYAFCSASPGRRTLYNLSIRQFLLLLCSSRGAECRCLTRAAGRPIYSRWRLQLPSQPRAWPAPKKPLSTGMSPRPILRMRGRSSKPCPAMTARLNTSSI